MVDIFSLGLLNSKIVVHWIFIYLSKLNFSIMTWLRFFHYDFAKQCDHMLGKLVAQFCAKSCHKVATAAFLSK